MLVHPFGYVVACFVSVMIHIFVGEVTMGDRAKTSLAGGDDTWFFVGDTLAYFGIFVFAETAFVLMAIKEYLQDLLHLTDQGPIAGLSPAERTRPSVASL